MRITRKLPQEAGNSTTLLLSIFLLLVAFFSVFIALGDFDVAKTSRVLNSVVYVFGQNTKQDPVDSENTAVMAPEVQADLIAEIALSLESYPAVRDLVTSPLGDWVSFNLAPDQLFEEPSLVLRRDRAVLMQRLATASAGLSPGRISIVLKIDRDSQLWRSKRPGLERLAYLRNTFTQRGAALDVVFLGFQEAEDTYWHFRIEQIEQN